MNIGSTRLKQFEQAIEGGQFLMMVDVPRSRVEEVTEMVKNRHPEADVKGVEPLIPAFP